MAATLDLEPVARALWIANGNRADLWDNDHNDQWGPHMKDAKTEYRERAVRFLAAMPDNEGRPD